MLDTNVVLSIMVDVFNALKNLHSVGYVHNDLKPNNIMFDKDMRAHLIDLGYATKFLDDSNQHIEVSDLTRFRGNLLFSTIN